MSALDIVLFYFFGTVALGSALVVVGQRNPTYSAFSLIVTLASLSAIFGLLGSPFIAVLQVVVYAGAIMVLFVFTIMLLNAGEEELTRGSRVALRFGAPAVAVLVAGLAYVLSRGNGLANLGDFVGGPKEIGRLLFRDFLLPFEVTSVLILIAIMGAVVLARREER